MTSPTGSIVVTSPPPSGGGVRKVAMCDPFFFNGFHLGLMIVTALFSVGTTYLVMKRD